VNALPAELISVSSLVYYYKGMALTREHVLSLLAAETPEEMRNALKGTWLEGMPIESMDSDELEKLAYRKYYEVLDKLRGYMPSKNLRDLIDVLKDCVRGRDVLLLLRAALSNKDINEVAKYLVLPDDEVVQNVLLVVKDRSVEGLGQALKGFRMAQYIEKALELYRTYKDTSVFTLVLDVMLLEGLFRLLGRVGKSMNVGTNKIEFARLLCPEIDTLSFTMVARLVLKGEKVTVEPPACDKDTLKQLVQARPEDVVPILRRTVYGTDLPDDPYEALAKLLVNGSRIQRRRAEAAFAGYPFRIAVVLALLLLYRLDAKDVSTIVAGKRAGLDISKIAEMLSFEILQ
jgi:vacuolar-type H+-ATPase subunit C/Vma6